MSGQGNGVLPSAFAAAAMLITPCHCIKKWNIWPCNVWWYTVRWVRSLFRSFSCQELRGRTVVKALKGCSKEGLRLANKVKVFKSNENLCDGWPLCFNAAITAVSKTWRLHCLHLRMLKPPHSCLYLTEEQGSLCTQGALNSIMLHYFYGRPVSTAHTSYMLL